MAMDNAAMDYDLDFDAIFNDAGDGSGGSFDDLFADEPAEEPKAEAKPKAEALKKAEEDELAAMFADEPEPAEEPKAEAKAEVPEAGVKENPKAEVKEESKAKADEKTKAKEPEVEVEVEMPAQEKAEKTEAGEPKKEAPKTRAAAPKKAEKKAPKSRKTAGAKPVSKEAMAAESAPISEEFVNSLIIVLGPKYEADKAKVSEMINNITITKGMPPAVVDSMVAQTNELEKFIMMRSQGYEDAYTSLCDKESGLIARIRMRTALTAGGTPTEQKNAGNLACMSYKDPVTKQTLDLFQYANALKQAHDFFENARDYVKSTAIALNAMRK